MTSLLYIKPVDVFKCLRKRWIKLAVSIKQYIWVFLEKEEVKNYVRVSLFSFGPKKDYCATSTSCNWRFLYRIMQLYSPKFEGHRHFQLLDIMVTWMSLRGSWAVPRSSLALHWPVAMIPFLYLSSFIHYQLYQSGETKLCYNNKTAIPQRLIFYSHKIWGSKHLSGDSCPPCVGGVMFWLKIVKPLYFMFTIFVRRQKRWHHFPPSVSFFHYFIS